jgi:hypothetical protein
MNSYYIPGKKPSTYVGLGHYERDKDAVASVRARNSWLKNNKRPLVTKLFRREGCEFVSVEADLTPTF